MVLEKTKYESRESTNLFFFIMQRLSYYGFDFISDFLQLLNEMT